MLILVLKMARIKLNFKWLMRLGGRLMVKIYFRDINQVLFSSQILESKLIIKDLKNNLMLGRDKKKVSIKMKTNQGRVIKNKVTLVSFLIYLLLEKMKLGI